MSYMLIIKKSESCKMALDYLEDPGRKPSHSFYEIDSRYDSQQCDIVSIHIETAIAHRFTPVLVGFENYIPQNKYCIVAEVVEIYKLLLNPNHRIVSLANKLAKKIMQDTESHSNFA